MAEIMKILVVDDEENLRHMLQVMLRKHGYHVETAPDGSVALQMASHHQFTFILCDIRMPLMDGPVFLKKFAEAGFRSTIIMMSAYGTMETAIACMKQGAYDYISKPFKNDEILLVLKKAEERERLKREGRQLKEENKKENTCSDIISENPRMLEIFQLVKKVCDFRTSVLILGDSGTGKELIARAIHFTGNRSGQPFVAVNCGALPEALLESELFGHVKGAFTNAVSDKIGLFEQADKGTLFLDEIGEMQQSLQVKLLRSLQENEIRPVGAGAVRKVDVRVISATSKDLVKEVERGRFREDLFYRLNVFSIKVPPLRDRPEDIPLLIGHFLDKFGTSLGKAPVRLTSNALQALMRYHWPGNVRELQNCIERGLILCEGTEMDLDSFPGVICDCKTDNWSGGMFADCLSIKKADEMLERELIRRALERTCGNRTHAAKLLEISHRALLYKLKEYGLE